MKIIILSLVLLAVTAQAQFDLTRISPAQTVQESVDALPMRQAAIFDSYLKQRLAPPPVWPKVGFHEFAGTMISRLLHKVELQQVSDNILRPDFMPWLTGTDFALIGSLCRRKGDYDFVLQILLRIAYIDDQSGQKLLTGPARDKMTHVLLSENGVEHHEKISVGGCMTVTDTENHILMTEVSRYLTNQLLFAEAVKLHQPTALYDNSKNGFDQWMLKHLAEFLKNDFSEFNSRPYEGYTQITLNNLYDYSKNLQVKKMAQMVLDYSGAKFAISSNGMRRSAPYRRQKDWLNYDDLVFYDTVVSRHFFLAGNYNYITFADSNRSSAVYNDDTYHAMMAAAGSYRTPRLILDTQIEKDQQYFQKIRHSDVEIYHSSPSFLLTSGGRYRDLPDFGTGGNDAWAVATTILPTKGEATMKNLFYIVGDKDVHRRNNTCMTKNFACGFNLHVPENLDASCVVKNGNWSFYDMQKCKNYGFYVAINQVKPDKDWDDVNANYNVMEVVEANDHFDQFMKSRMQQNPQKNIKPDNASTYSTYDGRTVEFFIYNANLGAYSVTKINGVKQTADFNLWPRAEGDVMNSVTPGLIEITNNKLRKKLTLDARNPLVPARTESVF